MATLQEVESAFLQAHKAGDQKNAAILAQEVQRLRSTQKQEVPSGPEYESQRAALVKESEKSQKARDAAYKELEVRKRQAGFVMGFGDVGNAAMRGANALYEAGRNAVTEPTPGEVSRGQRDPSEFSKFRQELAAANELGYQRLSPEGAPEGDLIGPGTMRLAGNLIATAPVGGSLGAGAKALGATRLGAALSSGGFTTGAKVAPGVVNRLADTAIRVAGGAGTGAASGYLGSGGDADAATAGAAIGGGIGLASGAVGGVANSGIGRWAKKTGQTLSDFVRKGGSENILNRITAQNVGEQNLPALIEAAKNAPDIIPGGKPTLAQAVAHLPEGSPLQAMQEATAKTKGGISADFGRRIAEQDMAVEAAKEARKAASKVNYGKAFEPNPAVKPDAELLSILNDPFVSDVIPIADKLSASKKLTPDSQLTEMLHNVKVALDARLKPPSGEKALDAATQKATLAAKERLTQWIGAHNTAYDVARESHKEASKPIADYIARQELAKNPLQKTLLENAANMVEGQRPETAHFFNRPMSILNYITKIAGRNVEGEVDALNAVRSLNPKQWAAAMEQFGKGPTPERLALEEFRRKALAQGGKTAANALAIGVGDRNAMTGAQ